MVRGGGVPATKTWSDITGGENSNPTWLDLAHGWQIYVMAGAHITNFKYTRATDKITLSGTLVSRKDTSTYEFILRNILAPSPGGKTYSYRCYIYPGATNASARMAHNANTVTEYSHLDNQGVYSSVLQIQNGGPFYPGIYIMATELGDFNISVGYPMFVEHRLCNMPYVQSLDVRPQNTLKVNNVCDKSLSTFKTQRKGWYRCLGIYGALCHDRRSGYGDYRFQTFEAFQTFYLYTSYHAPNSSIGDDQYGSYKIKLGILNALRLKQKMILEVENLGNNNIAYSKFRLARGTDIIYSSNLSGQTALTQDHYHVYLEVYYNVAVGSSPSYIKAYDNIGTTSYPYFDIDNQTGYPDGNNDILIGSEVTPTIVGTQVTIS